mmetsp:Transcript_21985/g.32368  ORF Transcript_21985/g.32368 Transcript_21985/m.32368 type:complete len:289 (+) Transcript_21985:163-1029(+)
MNEVSVNVITNRSSRSRKNVGRIALLNALMLFVMMVIGSYSFTLNIVLPTITTRVRQRQRVNNHFTPITGANLNELTPPEHFLETKLYSDASYFNNDDDEIDSSQPDWIQAELTLLKAPTEPSPDIPPEEIVKMCCRSLQFVDHPTENAGLERCYNFFSFECRKAVTARKGGSSIERFCQYGLLSPALQPFMGARSIRVGEGTYTPPSPPSRGALASFPVEILGASVLTLQYQSGMDRNGVACSPPVTNMVVRLEQQRRPPNLGCWLIREVLDIRHAFAGDSGNVDMG